MFLGAENYIGRATYFRSKASHAGTQHDWELGRIGGVAILSGKIYFIINGFANGAVYQVPTNLLRFVREKNGIVKYTVDDSMSLTYHINEHDELHSTSGPALINRMRSRDSCTYFINGKRFLSKEKWFDAITAVGNSKDSMDAIYSLGEQN